MRRFILHWLFPAIEEVLVGCAHLVLFNLTQACFPCVFGRLFLCFGDSLLCWLLVAQESLGFNLFLNSWLVFLFYFDFDSVTFV